MDTYIGIDNGVTGTLGIWHNNQTEFIATPIFSEQDYVKKKQNTTRVEWMELCKKLSFYAKKSNKVHVYIERPMINPKRWKASVSALRCLEATLIALELTNRRWGNVAHTFIDSKEWQSAMLPKGTTGSVELKKASFCVASRLFPEHSILLLKHKDGDGLLIMEYLKRRMERWKNFVD